MAFVHRHAPVSAAPFGEDLCIVVKKDQFLVLAAPSEELSLPRWQFLSANFTSPAPHLYVGYIGKTNVWCWTVEDETLPPAGYRWCETRASLALLQQEQHHAICCARQLLWWESRHRYCGHCSTPTIFSATERAKCCPKCGAVFYPTASPAIIVAIERESKLLLAHNRAFRPGMFSLLAGFVDPGETLEQAVVREVREEVGIEIHELQYLTSQPWPFPNSLMLAFRAKYFSGHLQVDGTEIESADWFLPDALPELPNPGTVARKIIDSWRMGNIRS